MEGNKPYELLEEVVAEGGYKVKETYPDANYITVIYQMSYVHISVSDADPNFASLVVPAIESADRENMDRQSACAMKITAGKKVVKAYLDDDNDVMLTYEFYYEGRDELARNIRRGLDHLLEARGSYRRLRNS